MIDSSRGLGIMPIEDLYNLLKHRFPTTSFMGIDRDYIRLGYMGFCFLVYTNFDLDIKINYIGTYLFHYGNLPDLLGDIEALISFFALGGTVYPNELMRGKRISRR